MTAPSRPPTRNARGPPAAPNSTASAGRMITLRKLNRNVVANCAHVASSHGGASASLTVPDVHLGTRGNHGKNAGVRAMYPR